MLCTLIEKPFDRPDWLFEIKWDGFRAIGSKHDHHISLRSRNNIDFVQKFPPVAEALRELDHDVLLDGEIVVVDKDGSPHFEWLQDWRTTGQGELRYQAFDILWCDGHDVRTMPLIDRKALLKSIIPTDSVIKYSDHVAEKGSALFEQMQHRGLEGIVAKQANSTYQEDVRGKDWLKIKTHLRQEVVIGGFTEPRGSREYLGSLIVGVYRNGEFEYVGHSGGGIPDAQRKQLRTKLEKLARKTSPFNTDVPKSDTVAHWVKPELVCEMNFAEWTSGGQMRQPRFVGMREDKKPMSVKREKPQNSNPTLAKPEFSHLDKVFFPRHGYTKGDLIKYYQSVADYILPYLADRPHSLLRQPGGVTDRGFFQKNMEHLPEWAPTADIYSESNKANIHWLVGGKLETLEYMVQLGCIEINPWNARVQHLDKPDWAVMDLDPEGVTFDDVITVAQTVHQLCDELDITAVPKTSGKTGIHVYMPLGAKYTHNQAKDFVHLLAIEVNKRLPKLTSLERMPEKRKHKIYLDYLQNREGQTLAAPYSVRPTPDATVATPLHWDEVKKGLLPTDYTIKNIHRRLSRVGDLWKPVLGPGNDLAKILTRLEKLHNDQS
jgi:bifunctional non-homologous end joining protein LigD